MSTPKQSVNFHELVDRSLRLTEAYTDDGVPGMADAWSVRVCLSLRPLGIL